MRLPTLVVTSLSVAATAAVGASATDPGSEWYAGLDKPPWQPPPAAYGLVWTPLYAALAVAAARAHDRLPTGEKSRFAAAFAANLALNAGWNWLFFRARSPRLSWRKAPPNPSIASTAGTARRPAARARRR